MNILPKKRWHVRTKENIARVRKDEAEAAEKERQEKLRIDQAERERRLDILKQKSKRKLESLDIPEPESNVTSDNNKTTHEHINLFSDIEHAVCTTNKDHDQEVKEKKEEYEKKIGYLTYLGQDTNEALGKKNWYEIPPDSSRFSRPDNVRGTYDKLVLKDEDGKPKKRNKDVKDGEVGWKSKQREDPIKAFQKYCSNAKKPRHCDNSAPTSEKGSKKISTSHLKQKKPKDTTIDKQEKLKKLREARLKREQEEKQKTVLYLRKLAGVPTSDEKKETQVKVVPKYNSQFNPELARQNFR